VHPELWRKELVTEGWSSFVFSFDVAPSSCSPTGPRRYGLVLASSLALVAHEPERFPVPWHERVLSATIHVTNGCVEITTTHVPPSSSNGWIKIDHLEDSVWLAAASSNPKLLCGDFNTPRRELPTGEVITLGQTEDGRFNRALGERWDAAEGDILLGLADLGVPDVFRALYGNQPQPASWILRMWRRSLPMSIRPRLRLPQPWTYCIHLRTRATRERSERPLTRVCRVRRARQRAAIVCR
jgi:hypothetical protein